MQPGQGKRSSGNCAILCNEKPNKNFIVLIEMKLVLISDFVHMAGDEEGVYSIHLFPEAVWILKCLSALYKCRKVPVESFKAMTFPPLGLSAH